MFLLEPIPDLEKELVVYNNQLITKNEVKSIVLDKFKSGLKFIKYNPLKFSREIQKHPLIKNAIVRTSIFSSNKFKILINEEKPWALFRNKLFNEKFELIKNYDEEIEQDFNSVSDLYNSILSSESKIIQIKSNNKLNKKAFKKLKKITTKLNERLDMIGLNHISKINIIDGELTLKNQDLKLILGQYKTGVKSKIRKLDHLLPKIKDHISNIEYLDLSLDTDEAIVGKRL